MKWQIKAKIMQVCATIPAGITLYKLIQKSFGNLNAKPLSKLIQQTEIAEWIYEQGLSIEGRTFFEVGTGHKPVLPIGFFLTGAKRIITVDINQRLDYDILRKTLCWMSENRDQIHYIYQNLLSKDILDEKLEIIDYLKYYPCEFLKEANIEYWAPADASATNLPSNSIDYHISTNVMEHIPSQNIKNIFKEAERLLTNNGAAIHFIDLSDHFQHQDKTISTINFLKYSEINWNRIAGNEFAYCNRLRASELLSLFGELPFQIVKQETCLDEESMASLKNGFLVDQRFYACSHKDLCTISLKIMLKKLV